MFCQNCGAEINDEAMVCVKCGVAVPKKEVASKSMPGDVPNHMVGAILSTVFCCLIGGIIAIVYASQVNTKLAQGDKEGALAASRAANGWIIANFIFGFAVLAIYICFAVATSSLL